MSVHLSQQDQKISGPGRTLLAAAVIMGALLLAAVSARAAEDQSYQALRNWIEQNRTPPPTFTPGRDR